MKKLLLLAFISIAMYFNSNAQLYVTGMDDASNYSQSDFVAEGNLGFGFGAWYTSNDNGGWFRGAASEQGANSGQIDVSGNSFGIWAGNYCNLGRELSASLPDGGTITFSYAYQWDNGNRGFSLLSGDWGTEIFNFNINSSGYSWTGGNTAPSTGWSGLREYGVAMLFTFTRSGADINYSFSSPAGGGPTGSGTLTGVNFDRIKFYVSGAGGGTGGNSYINSFKESFTNPGLVPSTDDVLVTGTAVMTGTQTLSTQDLTISSGASLTLQSGASLITGGTISGNITIEKTINDGNYHLFFPPVNSTVTASPTFNGYYLDKYVEADGEWTRLTDAGSVTPDQGYSLKHSFGSGSLSFTGSLFTGNQTFSNLSYTAAVSGYLYGWNLIGNPFPSAIDLDLGGFANTNLNGFVYVWNGSNYVSGPIAGGAGTLTDNIIPAFQGFFVRTENATNSLTIPQAARTHSSQAFYKQAKTFENVISLSVSGNNASDRMLLVVNPEATAGYDSRFDAFKLFGNADAPQLYTVVGDENLSVNSVNSIDNSTGFPVMLKVGADGLYTLTAGYLDTFMNGTTDVILTDLLTNTRQNLSQNPFYTFNATTGDDAARFKLSFANVGVEENPLRNIGIYAANGHIVLQLPESMQVRVTTTNMAGQVIASENIEASGNVTLDTPAVTGIYLVTLTTLSETISRKVIIK